MRRRATFIVHPYEFRRGTFVGGQTEIGFIGHPVCSADCSLDAISLNMTMQLRVDTKEEDFQVIVPAVMFEEDPRMIKDFPRVPQKHFRLTIDELGVYE